MTDSMKFGPEWLRNMSNDVGSSSSSTSSGAVSMPFGMPFNNNNNASNNTNNCAYSLASSPAPRYPLAEFRYGREEMLSLYDKNVKLPELLPKFKKLFIEKIQCPLALLPPSIEDDVRLWQMRTTTVGGGLTSERGGGSDALGLASGTMNMSSLGTGSSLGGISSRGTRGSSIDRGRGRVRGGLYHSTLGGYQRSGFVYDDETRGIGGRSDRQWSERNGGSISDTLDWNGASSTTSPRKEYLTRSGESWRRNRLEEENSSNLNGTTDGWRSSGSGSTNMYKWPARSTSWRGEADLKSSSPTKPSGPYANDGSFIGNTTPHRLERSMSHTTPTNRDGDSVNSNIRRVGMHPSWDEDNLPEWAMDEPMEGGGSFDATGAFHGAEEGDSNCIRMVATDSSGGNIVKKDANHNAAYKIVTKPSPDQNDENFDTDNANGTTETVRWNAKLDERKNNQKDDIPSKSSASRHDEKSTEPKSHYEKESVENIHVIKKPEPSNNNKPSENTKYIESHAPLATPNLDSSGTSGVDRMKEVASDIEKLIMDDDLGSERDGPLRSANKNHLENAGGMKNGSKATGSTPTSFLNLIPSADNISGLVGLQSFSPSQQQGPSVLQHAPPATGATPELWFYRDPQGKVQGPFTATEMAEWYRAGYFDESLFVRRVCDSRFSALGDLLKVCGGAIPFLSSHLIPPLSIVGESNMSIAPGMSSMSATNKPPLQLGHPTPPVQPVLSCLDAPQPDNMNLPAALNYHMHNVHKQYMLRQQAIIIQKLSETDHWPLLNPEQQATLIAQRMAQVPIPENLTLQQQQQQSILMHQMMTGSNHIPHQKSPVPNKPALMKQQQSLPHIFNHNPHHEFSPNGSNNSGANDSVQQLLHSMSMNQIQIPPPVPMPTSTGQMPHPSSAAPHQPTPSQIMVDNDPNPIKSLIYQLSMQKRSSPNLVQQQQQQPPQISMATNEKWMPGGGTINLDPSVVAVQHQSNQQSAQMAGQWNSSNTPMSMWDIPIPPVNAGPPIGNLHNNLVPKSSMKTEMQILEEHLKLKMKEDHMKKEMEFMAAQQQHTGQWNTQKNISQTLIKQFPQQPSAQIQLGGPQQILQQQQQQQQQPQPIPHHPQPQHQPQQQQQHSDSISNCVAAQHQQSTPQIQQLQIDDLKKIANDKIKTPCQEEAANIELPTSDADHTIATKQLQKNVKKNKTDAVNASSIKSGSDDGRGKKKVDGPASNDTDNALNANNNNDNNNKNNATTKQNAKEGGKKKSKDKEAKVTEEKKRQQEEEERQYLEEKKRLEDIAEQRKSKLMEHYSRAEDSAQRESNGQKRNNNNSATSVAPWSAFATGSATSSGSPSLAEIQRTERERRAEQFRVEQAIREQQQSHAMLEQQQQKDSVLKWNLKPQNQIKSLAEIQAEESKARQVIEQQQLANQQSQKKDTDKFTSLWNNATLPLQWSNAKMWADAVATNPPSLISGSSTSASGFWEEPIKPLSSLKSNASSGTTPAGKTLSKCLTVSNMQTQATVAKPSGNAAANVKATTTKANLSSSGATNMANNNTLSKKSKTNSSKKSNTNNDDNGNNEFNAWCSKALAAHVDIIDVPTFISFLRDIDSPFEVKDYIRMYLGENKECSEFAKHFLERRSKYKSMQRAANAHIDDMCSPAPALTPALENQESKNKGKKEKKKSKMTKLDSRILGFSITSAEDRLNVGDRDYARE